MYNPALSRGTHGIFQSPGLSLGLEGLPALRGEHRRALGGWGEFTHSQPRGISFVLWQPFLNYGWLKNGKSLLSFLLVHQPGNPAILPTVTCGKQDREYISQNANVNIRKPKVPARGPQSKAGPMATRLKRDKMTRPCRGSREALPETPRLQKEPRAVAGSPRPPWALRPALAAHWWGREEPWQRGSPATLHLRGLRGLPPLHCWRRAL